jgi:hypothetical protein
MDPLEIMEWVEDDDDILASLQTTISLIIRRRNKEPPLHSDPVEFSASYRLLELVCWESLMPGED